MKLMPQSQDRARELVEALIVAASIAGLLLINACAYHYLSRIMSDVSSSVALLAVIGR
jgi:hypothetical protein